MNTNLKRRAILKGTVAGAGTAAAVGAGLLTPNALWAAWNEQAFQSKDIDAAVNSAMGSPSTDASDKVNVKAPDIAENGAVVPITVTSTLPGVESIAVLVEKNAIPLSAIYHLPKGTLADVSVRLKMGKTSDVIAVVKSGGKLYAGRKSVKVTIGGCGG